MPDSTVASGQSDDWGPPVDDELRLSDYLHILRRRWMWIAGVFVAVLVLAVALSMTQQTEYRAEAEVIIRNTTNESLFPSARALSSHIQREPTAELLYISSDTFVSAADAAAGSESDVDVEIKVLDPDERIPGISGVLVFTATADTALQAVAAATAYSDAYVVLRHTEDVAAVDRLVIDAQSAVITATSERNTLREPLEEIDSQIAATSDGDLITSLLARRNQVESQIDAELARIDIELNRALDDLADAEDLADIVADPASAARVNIGAEFPGSPSSPGLIRNIALAVVVGAILGIGAALLRDSLDDTVGDVDLIQRRLGLPFLGGLPILETKTKGNGKARSVFIRRRDAEAFRSIRTSLRFAGPQGHPLNVMGITSPAPEEGKTLCAMYLTSALAFERGSVLLVDADLRRRTIASRIGLDNTAGLSDVLSGQATADEVIQTVEGTSMDVMTAGPASPNPSELLGSTEFEQMIKDLSTRYEAIVVDCPPLLAVADPRLIGTAVDAMLLVLASGSTKLSEAERSAELLREAGAHIAGFILNKATERAGSYYGYQYAEDYTDPD